MNHLHAFEIKHPLNLLTYISNRRDDPYNYANFTLQKYLTEEDFLQVFGISVHDFKGMPAWKQANLKKKVDLF